MNTQLRQIRQKFEQFFWENDSYVIINSVGDFTFFKKILRLVGFTTDFDKEGIDNDDNYAFGIMNPKRKDTNLVCFTNPGPKLEASSVNISFEEFLEFITGFKIGTKVVPTTKSVFGKDLCDSGQWYLAKEQKQPYLYLNSFGFEEEQLIAVLGLTLNPESGDFFTLTDFHIYKKAKSQMKDKVIVQKELINKAYYEASPTQRDVLIQELRNQMFGLGPTVEVSREFAMKMRPSVCEKWQREIDKHFEPEKTYKIGNRFRRQDGDTCVLCSFTGTKAGLITIETGCRWDDGIEVKDLYHITKTEMSQFSCFPDLAQIN